MPDPTSSDIPVAELYKNLESPRQYYASVADSIPDPKTARTPSTRSMQDLHPLTKQPSPIQRRASIVLSQMPQHSSDHHISAHEPRAFPGIVHERHRRTSVRRKSHGTDDGHATGSEMSSSLQMEPGLAKQRIKEQVSLKEVEDSE